MPLTAGLTGEIDVLVGSPDRRSHGKPRLQGVEHAGTRPAVRGGVDSSDRNASGRTVDRQRRHTNRGGAYRGDAYRHASALQAKVVKVDGRRVSFTLEAHDEKELIGKGTHERFLGDPAKFLARVEGKAQ